MLDRACGADYILLTKGPPWNGGVFEGFFGRFSLLGTSILAAQITGTERKRPGVNEYEILLLWDDDARVWIAQNDDIPLVLESGSLDLLMEQVRLAVPEILELNGREHEDVYLDFTSKRRAKVIA